MLHSLTPVKIQITFQTPSEEACWPSRKGRILSTNIMQQNSIHNTGPFLHPPFIYEIISSKSNHQSTEDPFSNVPPAKHFLFPGNKVCCLGINQVTQTPCIMCGNCSFENNFLGMPETNRSKQPDKGPRPGQARV